MTAGDCPAIQKTGAEGTIIATAGNSKEYRAQWETRYPYHPTHAPEQALEDYRQCRQTECLLAVMKRRGFNLERQAYHRSRPGRSIARGHDLGAVLVL
ncbi:hypothetical protein [Nitrosococcus oceani]|uniref:hypothetical protein n=1 Tax=Nitrosococcus oceani TaxID=1229 RepID=UPI0004E8D524|nr:hypothetical protein [Nitrosococcus oceani]KFI22098.1 hypothetical protein HW44_11430 [Nitrosococcus oceani]